MLGNTQRKEKKYPPHHNTHTHLATPLLLLPLCLPPPASQHKNFTTGLFCSLITNVPRDLLHPDKTRRAGETIRQAVWVEEKKKGPPHVT